MFWLLTPPIQDSWCIHKMQQKRNDICNRLVFDFNTILNNRKYQTVLWSILFLTIHAWKGEKRWNTFPHSNLSQGEWKQGYTLHSARRYRAQRGRGHPFLHSCGFSTEAAVIFDCLELLKSQVHFSSWEHTTTNICMLYNVPILRSIAKKLFSKLCCMWRNRQAKHAHVIEINDSMDA